MMAYMLIFTLMVLSSVQSLFSVYFSRLTFVEVRKMRDKLLEDAHNED